MTEDEWAFWAFNVTVVVAAATGMTLEEAFRWERVRALKVAVVVAVAVAFLTPAPLWLARIVTALLEGVGHLLGTRP